SKPFAFAADVDRNNAMDLIAGNPCNDALSVLYGTGDGSFAPAAGRIELPGRLTAAAMLDLNGDGLADLVGGNAADRSMWTLPAKASGGFTEIRSQAVSAVPRAFEGCDFNGDDRQDVAFLTEDRLKIVLLFGAGDGSFSGSSEITFSDSVAAFCAADFDGDARPDLAVYDHLTLTLTPFHLYKGDGEGGFTWEKDFAGLLGANLIEKADVNNDGHLDIIALGLMGAVVHLGDGAGNFSIAENEEFAILGQVSSALVLDVDGDANPDLVVGDFSEWTRHVKVFPGTGDGRFSPSFTHYGVSGIAGTLCAADFNSDGATDIAVVHPDTGLVSVLSGAVRLEHDIAVKSILAPAGSVLEGCSVTPRAVVLNRGASPENCRLECRIGDSYRNTVDIRLESGEQKEIVFPPWIPANAGNFSVEVTAILEGDQIPANNRMTAGVTVTAGADGGALSIRDITPDHGGNDGWLSVTVSGTGFIENTEIKLIRGGKEIRASGYSNEQTVLIDSTAFKAVFDLNGAETGGWDVAAVNPDGDSFTFENGLVVEQAKKTLWVDLLGPSQFALSAHHTTLLSYDAIIGNSGNINLEYAVMVLELPKWLDLMSIVRASDNDTLLLGDGERIYNVIEGEQKDSMRVADIDSTIIPLYIGVLNPNEVVTFKLNVRGNWTAYRDQVIRQRPGKAHHLEDDDGGGIGISAFLMDGVKCFGKNLAESVADKGDLTLQDFEDAGEKTLESMGENLFWTGVTITIEILCPWTIPFIEGYNIAKKLIGSIESAEQMFRLALKFLLLFAEWWGDPNFKEGPVGYGAAGYVTDNRPYFYQIHFENDSSATASPPWVIVRDTLDSDLEWSTFKNAGSSHPLTSTVLDSATGEVVWRFDGIDLPPNRIPPEGEAWLSYSVLPKTGLASGTSIMNRASIVFAGQDTILTNTVVNTIDRMPPTARVEPLASSQDHVAFTVSWSGEDSESGIHLYNIYVSRNNGAFELWTQTEGTSEVFIGRNGESYSFYCTATDHVGHVGASPQTPDAATVISAAESIGVNPNPFVPSRGHQSITFFGEDVANAEIRIYNKAGRMVAKLRESEGKPRLDWDATNEHGDNLSSGVYFWILAGKKDAKNKGKFAIIR
ncbi:VCBS repeat-containing protein, partial [bacterium]|nr:VCBS repeat-containing protein [bacterium]